MSSSGLTRVVRRRLRQHPTAIKEVITKARSGHWRNRVGRAGAAGFRPEVAGTSHDFARAARSPVWISLTLAMAIAPQFRIAPSERVRGRWVVSCRGKGKEDNRRTGFSHYFRSKEHDDKRRKEARDGLCPCCLSCINLEDALQSMEICFDSNTSTSKVAEHKGGNAQR
jgi:hypothetical protein